YDVSRLTRITLSDDGSFEIVDMPDWWNNGFGKSYRGFASFSGRWALSNIGGHWRIGLSFFGTRRFLNLVEHKMGGSPPYCVEIIVGDPDSGDEMIFVRKE
ncbi:MAG TPA: hypothetical protein VF064_06355, partial [Pyrinomonadaceae bacterium]